MNIREVNLRDLCFVPNTYNNYGPRVFMGRVIEINIQHQTVLIKGLYPYTNGNFGAKVKDLYRTEREALEAYTELLD